MRRTRIGKPLVTVGSFGSAASQWLIILILARKYGPTDLGAYSTILAYATPIYVGSSLALRDIYLSLKIRVPWASYVLTRTVSLSAGTAVMILMSCIMAWPSELALAVIVLKIADSGCDLTYGRLQRENRWLPLGILLCLNPIVSVALMLGVVLLGQSIALAVSASAFVSIATLFGSSLLSRDKSTPFSAPRWRDVPMLSRSGTPVVGAQLLSSLLLSVPVFFLQVTGGASDIGVYSVLAYLVTFGNLFGSAMSTIEINRLRGELEANGALSLARLAAKIAIAIAGIGLALSIPVVIFGPYAFVMIYGPEFHISRPLIAIFCVCSVVSASGFMGGATLLLCNRYWRQVIASMAALLGATLIALVLVVDGPFAALYSASLIGLAGAVLRTTVIWTLARYSAAHEWASGRVNFDPS